MLDDLNRWIADAAAAEVALDRRRERMLQQAAEQGATLAGLLVDLAERAELVVVRTTAARTHRGRVTAVARDFVVLQAEVGAPALVAMAHVATIRDEPAKTGPLLAGSRLPPVRSSFAAVLAGMAAERPRVSVGVTGEEEVVTGQLRSVGHDVLTIRLDGPAAAFVHTPVAAIADVVLLDRA